MAAILQNEPIEWLITVTMVVKCNGLHPECIQKYVPICLFTFIHYIRFRQNGTTILERWWVLEHLTDLHNLYITFRPPTGLNIQVWSPVEI